MIKQQFDLIPISRIPFEGINLRNNNLARPLYDDFWATFFVLILELFDQTKNLQQLYIIQRLIKPLGSFEVNKSIDILVQKVRLVQRDKTLFDIIQNNGQQEMSECFSRYIAKFHQILLGKDYTDNLEVLANIFQINLIIFNNKIEQLVYINVNYITLHLIRYSNIWFRLYNITQPSLSMEIYQNENESTKCSHCRTKSEHMYFARNCQHPYCEDCLNLKFRYNAHSACNVCERSLRDNDFSNRLINQNNYKDIENFRCCGICFNQINKQNFLKKVDSNEYCSYCIMKYNINQTKSTKYDCKEQYIYQKGQIFHCVVCQTPYYGLQKQFQCQSCNNSICIFHQDLLSQCFCSCEQCGMRSTASNEKSRSCNTCNKEFCLGCQQFRLNSNVSKNNYNKQTKKNGECIKYVNCQVCGDQQQQSMVFINLECYHKYCFSCVEKNLNSFYCCIQGCKQNILHQEIQDFYSKASNLMQCNLQQIVNCSYCDNTIQKLAQDKEYIQCNVCQKFTCLNHLQLLDECQCRCKICFCEFIEQLGESCKFCDKCKKSFCGLCFEKIDTDDDSAITKQNEASILQGLCDCIISDVCSCDKDICGQCLTRLSGQMEIQDHKSCNKHKFCFICISNSNQINKLKCQICSGKIKKIKQFLAVRQEFIISDHYSFELNDFMNE